MESVLLDVAGHRRSPATMPGYHRGRPPRNKGEQYPADPPTVEEIVAVMSVVGDRADGHRLRALVVLLWRAGLRISEALALQESDLGRGRGSSGAGYAELGITRVKFTHDSGVCDVHDGPVLMSGGAVMFRVSWMTATSSGARGATWCDGCGCRPGRVDSFTVIGPDLRPVELIDEYLAWLTDCERSPNTVEAYAHDLRAFWTFLAERGLRWDQVDVMELGEFAAWARRPAANVVVLADEAARLSARSVNRMLSGVVGLLRVPGPPRVDARAGSGRQDSVGPGRL